MDGLARSHPRAVARKDYRRALVRVNEEAIAALQKPAGLKGMGATLDGGPLAAAPCVFVPYFVAMNTLNYMFWDMDASGKLVRYERNGKVGALAMQDAFQGAWLDAEGARSPEMAARVLRMRIEREGVRFILGDIPEADSRREVLLEVLEPSKLMSVSNYLADRVVKTGSLGWGDAQLLAYLFPRAYGDEYLKKAQLTLMFIAGEWNASQPARACELDVTAAADYQLPKVLRTLGLLEYASPLAAAIDSEQLLSKDGVSERALRAATILACDRLAEQFACSIAEVDFWLWLNRNQARDAKFHLTRTTAY